MVMKQSVKTNEKKPLFQLFFLKNNEDLGVEVDEVERIDFELVTQRLKRGESIFIAQKRPREIKINQRLPDAKKTVYFAYI